MEREIRPGTACDIGLYNDYVAETGYQPYPEMTDTEYEDALAVFRLEFIQKWLDAWEHE